MNIAGRVRWLQRQRLCRLAGKADAPQVGQHALALTQLVRGWSVAQVADAVCAALSTAYQWAQWFRDGGIAALEAERRGSERWTMTAAMAEALETLGGD